MGWINLAQDRIQCMSLVSVYESCEQGEESAGFINCRIACLVGRLLPDMEEQITTVSVIFRMKWLMCNISKPW